MIEKTVSETNINNITINRNSTNAIKGKNKIIKTLMKATILIATLVMFYAT